MGDSKKAQEEKKRLEAAEKSRQAERKKRAASERAAAARQKGIHRADNAPTYKQIGGPAERRTRPEKPYTAENAVVDTLMWGPVYAYSRHKGDSRNKAFCKQLGAEAAVGV